MPANKNDVNSLLDSLYLELLHLIEQHAECRVKIGEIDNFGIRLLAKARLHYGKTISVNQIPTEDCEDFKAICSVEEETNADTVSGTKKHLVRHKPNKAEGYLEPIYRFSVMPSITLRNAADLYKKSVELVVEAANIQTEMLAVMNSIDSLKTIKQQLA